MAREDLLSARWRDREEARLALNRLQLAAEGSLERTLHHAGAIASKNLGVERVSVWVLNADQSQLESRFVLDSRGAPAGERLRLADIATYQEAILELRVLAADDVRTNRLTRELADSYFAPLQIVSTLDAPLYRDGKVFGVLCLEHRGALRHWTESEKDFGASVADMVAMMFVAAELKQAEQTLRDREGALHELHRADALSRVARGVAHDLNNILTVISAQAERLKRPGVPPEIVKVGDALVDVVNSASRLTRQLITYGRKGSSSRTTLELDAVLRSVEATLRTLAGEHRHFSMTLGAGAARVRVEAAQLEQVVLNLVVNARQATEPDGAIGVVSRVEGDQVTLVVTDDGHGMDEPTRARIFEPFFTTRDDGTGLGLATVHGVVTSIAGTIEVQSSPSKGARFTIRLPLAAAS